MNVRLTESQKIKVLNSDDLYSIMRQVLLRENKIDRNKEHFWLVCLANNYQILMIELISLGSVNATIVEPMDVFSFALQKRAVRLIMVHNHPSGELTPSGMDVMLTDKMRAIGKFINVPVVDHLIISEKSYCSFADTGLMEQLEEENRFDLTFAQQDRLRAQAAQAQYNTQVEMAKRMLADGLPVDMIVKYTDLPASEVERLREK